MTEQPPQIIGKLGREGIVALTAMLQHDSPAVHMRIVLCEAKRQGMTFDQAWAVGLRTIPRGDESAPEWREQLKQDRDDWRAAYLGLAIVR